MTDSITMPSLSPTMETGTLARWLVKKGQSFKVGEAIAEIETDKATLELEATDAGIITAIVVPEGTEEVPVGAVIAKFSKREPSVVTAILPTTAVQEAKSVALLNQDSEGHGHTDRTKLAAGVPAASPLARRVARERGIDLNSLKGSGPRGRILRADIDSAVAESVLTAQSLSSAIPTASAQSPTEDVPREIVRLSLMRRTIAARMTESKRLAPHAYLTIDVEMDAAVELRRELNEASPEFDRKYSINDLVIWAMARALAEEPRANVQFAGENLITFKRVDLAVAVAVKDGLMTPIVRGAESKSLADISDEMHDLSARARAHRLKPEEYSGGTASLSNMGMMGVKQFEAVINPPHGLILAVGAVEKRPIVLNEELAIANVMTATASFDHRAMDGEACASFLQRFKRALVHPIRMVL